jgi:phage minor structural protein, N-terminal domain protein|uniref:Endopeptidase tail n=1 Tax=Siphoviridae sp. ctlQ13 TaxID=2825648 RepID=A0A8S5QBT1_9CAUD|nr:MAG TPA: endopeptidase tail [Siphoviridae sp. ctlQ13]
MYILKYAGSVLHDPRTDVQISAGILKEESGQSPTLSITIQPMHPLWDSFTRDAVMLPNREVELLEFETGIVLFRGRVRAISMEFDGSKKLTCEGAMAYLNDTTVRPYKTYDTDEIECDINAPAEANKLFEWFIEQHNAHVMNACEKFRIGVNAGANYGKLQRGTGTGPATLKEMRDKLEKACGGWLRVRYDATGSIIDWLPDTGAAEATQRVELGSNLLDLDTQVDGKDIYTAIVPVGKTGRGEDEHKVNVSAETAYVPFGFVIQDDAVVDMTAAEKYGLIEKTISYDLDKPQALADKAVADLAAGKLDDSIEVSAFDLHNLNEQTLPIDFLDRVFVKSGPHGIERYMICSGRTINLTNPTATQYKLGAITATLTKGATSSQESAQESIAKRVTSLSNATRNIAKDAATTTIKVAAVEEKAAAVEKKADAATEKIADVATTATAAAEKVETVAAKAEKAAEEVSHVATDAKNANDTAKEAKTMATEASNKAAEVKATADDMANAFSHDESGAHVGDKDGVHTTIDSHGMKLLKGSEELAKFEQSAVSLGGGVFNIVDGYNYGKDDTKVTAVFARHLLFNSGGAFFVNAPTIRLDISDDKNGNTAKGIGLGSFGFIARDRTHRREEVIAFEDLAKLIKFTSWTTLQDDGVCRVRYCIRGGMLYLDCYLAAGYSTRTTTAQMPKELLPAINGYHSLGTQTGNNTAKIWIGSANGNDGHIYFYNWSSGYATGIIPILPKSME